MIRPTLFLYIMWQFLLGIALAFIVLLGIIMLVDFVELSRRFGDNQSVGMIDTFMLTGLKAPQLIEETLPFVVLFGTMNALSKLNSRSELIVMRAAGLSAWRFLIPGIFVTLAIGLFWALVMNPVAIKSDNLFNEIRDEFNDNSERNLADKDSSELEKIWLREGNQFSRTVIFAESGNLKTRTLQDITIYQFIKSSDGDTQFSTRFDADSARLTDESYWLFSDVMETVEGRQTQFFETLTVQTKLTLDDLRAASGKEVNLPFWQLPSEISKFQAAGFTATSLTLRLNRLLALPIMLTAMLLIAAGASMQLTRLGGTLSLIIYGVAIGFIVYFTNNMVCAFGETGALPPIFAAWAVPVFILFVSIARLCIIEDG